MLGRPRKVVEFVYAGETRKKADAVKKNTNIKISILANMFSLYYGLRYAFMCCLRLKFVGVAALMLAAAIILPTKSFACACCDTFQARGFPEWDTLNVRAGPGVNFAVLATLQYGECGIQKLGPKRGNWIRIRSGNKIGWVNKRYIKWTQ